MPTDAGNYYILRISSTATLIGPGTFKNCDRIKEVYIDNFESKIPDASEMFSGCSSLKEVNVSNFNTRKVTDMGGMFTSCSSLTKRALKASSILFWSSK